MNSIENNNTFQVLTEREMVSIHGGETGWYWIFYAVGAAGKFIETSYEEYQMQKFRESIFPTR